MYQFSRTVGGVALTLLLSGAGAGPAVLEAQRTAPGPDGRWPLQPLSADNHILAPFMEGWYANEDGTYTISFGYSNANLDTLYIPVGEDNLLDPAQFNGMQPTVFLPGHHRGIFTVTLPADMKDQDVWWTLTKANGDVTRVPGRTSSMAYELDWVPRPHGGLPPSVSFDSQSGVGRGPPGIVAERTYSRCGRISPHPLGQRYGPLPEGSGRFPFPGGSPSRGVVPAPGSRTGGVHAARVQPAP